MLFFLWGVFRVKKVNCLQDGSGSPKFCTSRNIPTAITSLPDRNCSLGLKDKDDSSGEQSRDVAKSFDAPSKIELPCFSSEVNGDPDIKLSSIDPKGQYKQVNLQRQDCRINSIALSRTQTSSVSPPFAEKISLEKHAEVTRKFDASIGSRPMVPLSPLGRPFDRQRNSSQSLKTVEVDTQDGDAATSVVVQDKTISRVNSSKSQVKLEWELKEEDGSVDTTMRDLAVKNPPVATPIAWNNANSMIAIQKHKTGLSGLYTSSSKMDGVVGNYLIKEEKEEEACDKEVTHENLGKSESYFFPVDPLPQMKDIGLGNNNLMPWKALSPKDNNLVHDTAPNLELALGAAETKLSRPVMQPFPEKDQNLENASASLSLSLAFPFPEKKQETAEPSLERGQRHTNNNTSSSSLLLFGGFPDN